MLDFGPLRTLKMCRPLKREHDFHDSGPPAKGMVLRVLRDLIFKDFGPQNSPKRLFQHVLKNNFKNDGQNVQHEPNLGPKMTPQGGPGGAPGVPPEGPQIGLGGFCRLGGSRTPRRPPRGPKTIIFNDFGLFFNRYCLIFGPVFTFSNGTCTIMRTSKVIAELC